MKPIRYLSVCSGIEAASVAWEPLGWVPVAFAEIAAFPSKVLAHHWPHVPNLGDFTAVDVATLGPVDLLVGGTPCQAFSFAGLRRSLSDVRGNLSLAYAKLAHELARSNGLRWAVWENVPGVLSTTDNAFGCFLGALAGSDGPLCLPRGIERWPDEGMAEGPLARIAWRLLDAQYFRLAQRRRRVFVVVGFGEGADPAAVLFEPQGVLRHPPTRGEAWPDTAVGSLAGTSAGGGWRIGADEAAAGQLVAGTLCANKKASGSATNQDAENGLLVAHSLRAQHNVSHRDGRQDFESETFVVAHTLRGNGFDASEDGTGRGTPLVPVCFDTTQITSAENRCNPQPGDPCHPLSASAHPPAIALDLRNALRDPERHSGHDHPDRQGLGIGGDVSFPLTAGNEPGVATSWAVRRLTPTECERLMGFPEIREECRVNIWRSSDNPLTCALAAMQNPKSPPSAWNAAEDVSSASASSAANRFYSNRLDQELPVAARVLINSGREVVEISKAGRSIWLANNAERSDASLLPIPLDDFVRLVALTITTEVRRTQVGRVAYPRSETNFLDRLNGSASVDLCGPEIDELVGDAAQFMEAATRCIKFTTSHVGQSSQTLEQISRTSFCCAVAAIALFIPEIIPKANSYTVIFETVKGHTDIPGAKDGPRYMALGNSKAVPVVAWIGRRIAAVESSLQAAE